MVSLLIGVSSIAECNRVLFGTEYRLSQGHKCGVDFKEAAVAQGIANISRV